MKKSTGFTLLELLVVIGIIAILAALMFPAYRKMLERGKAVQCKTNLRSLWQGAMSYANDLPEIINRANQNSVGSIVGGHAEVPARLPQFWVYPTPFLMTATTAGWRGQAGLTAITNETAFLPSQNYEFTQYPTLFPYVDRSIQVYVCPTFRNYMKSRYPARPTIYRNYVINDAVWGSISRGGSQADLAKLSMSTQAVHFVLFTEMLIGDGTADNDAPAAFTGPPAMVDRYHNARQGAGMQFSGGTINAIYLDGHIEAVTNLTTF